MFLVSLIIVNVFIFIALKIYNKVTCGICKSSKHLVDKVVIVTGANTGIGYETAKDLAERGAKVILACRDESKGKAACQQIIESTGNKDVQYRNLDLSSLKSVREFAKQFLKEERRLDVLINNAGIYGIDRNKTEDGLDIGMQVNHFGPFLLTNLLLPILKTSAPSRIVNVSSELHRRGNIDVNDLNYESVPEEKFSKKQVYADSKLCNILTTIELSQQLQGTGVTVNALHPGVIADTEILRHESDNFSVAVKLFAFLGKTVWEGAQTTIFLAVSQEVAGISGKYYCDCRERNVSVLEKRSLARQLWEKSVEHVKIN